jgi:hypothetical protein
MMILEVPETDVRQKENLLWFNLGDTVVEIDALSNECEISVGGSSSVFTAKSVGVSDGTVKIEF